MIPKSEAEMRGNVRYEQKMRERAKREKKFLVTVAVNGRQIGDDSCMVQLVADKEIAKRLAGIALELLRPKPLTGQTLARVSITRKRRR